MKWKGMSDSSVCLCCGCEWLLLIGGGVVKVGWQKLGWKRVGFGRDASSGLKRVVDGAV